MKRRDEDVEVVGPVDVEEWLLPGHRALRQRGVRIVVATGVWGEILGRRAHDAGEDLIPDAVRPGADDTVPRQPLLLRGVDDETVESWVADSVDQRVRNETAAGEPALVWEQEQRTSDMDPPQRSGLRHCPLVDCRATIIRRGNGVHGQVLRRPPEVDQCGDAPVGLHLSLHAHLAVDGHVVGGQSQSCDRGVVADLDIDIVAAGLEEERLADRIKLARGQRLNLGDRVHRGLNSAGGRARVEDGHVRSKVRLHRVTETERANREQTTEKSGARHIRKG
jgi:hypothetical protein